MAVCRTHIHPYYPEEMANPFVKPDSCKCMIATKVKDYAQDTVHTISSEATILEAAEVMFNYNIGALIVVEEGEHVGIFTERDFLRAAYTSTFKKDSKVVDYFSKPIISVKENEVLGRVTQLMLNKRIRRLPVVDDQGKVSGFCSIRDVLGAIHNSFLAIMNS